ncbi:MAG: 2-oxoglutarate and iron-dependent oxygenase domain-containing protein, partial [Corynebacterium sp.]
MNDFHVPVIDISAYTGAYTGDSGEGERDAVARQIDDAARDVGFIQLTGHGIATDTWDGLADALDAFFLRDLETKKRV